MVIKLRVAQALPLAPSHQDLGCIRHAFQSPADDQIIGASRDAVGAKNSRLHAASAGFVNGDCAGGVGDAGS